MTPQQMRELADEVHERVLSMVLSIENDWGSGAGIETLRKEGDTDVLLADSVSAALRTAADQLEAVPEQLHDILGHIEMPEEAYVSLYAWYQRLTADTAPQEDRAAVDWERFDREVLGDD